MQTIRRLLRKRHTITVAIWLALVLLGWLIFPPLPVFSIPDGSRVVASSVDGHWIATVGRIRWDDDKLTPGDPDIEDKAAKLNARMGVDRLGNLEPLDLWDLRDTSSRKRLVSSEQRVRGVPFSKAGDLLLALREDELCVWETRTGKQLLAQKSGELYSLRQALVEANSEPPMVAMLRRTKPMDYSSSSYEGEVDFLALPSGETHTTIGPVQIEPDSEFMPRGKASLRISRDHKIAVTLQPAAGGIAATQFKQWEISSGKLLATLVVSSPPIYWTISHDGAELIQLTQFVSRNTEQDPSSATGRFAFQRQIEYWEFESSKLRKRLVADESSVAQEFIENCFGLRPASDNSLLRVDGFLVDTSGDRLDILAGGFDSRISPDGALTAAKQGAVSSVPVTGRVSPQPIELKRMPSGEVLRTIEAHPGWPEDKLAFYLLAFSPDQQKLTYVDNTDSGPLAIMMAYWGDLWNGSLLQSDTIRRGRTRCLRSMDISTGRTNVVLRSASEWLLPGALDNQYVLNGDQVWRLSGGSPWLHIFGLPTGVVVLMLTWKHLRTRRKIRMRKIDPEVTN